MNEVMKQRYVSRVANIERNLRHGRPIVLVGSIDGVYRITVDSSPRNLVNNCKDLGMDCSTFIFHHCDLGRGHNCETCRRLNRYH